MGGLEPVTQAAALEPATTPGLRTTAASVAMTPVGALEPVTQATAWGAVMPSDPTPTASAGHETTFVPMSDRLEGEAAPPELEVTTVGLP